MLNLYIIPHAFPPERTCPVRAPSYIFVVTSYTLPASAGNNPVRYAMCATYCSILAMPGRTVKDKVSSTWLVLAAKPDKAAMWGLHDSFECIAGYGSGRDSHEYVRIQDKKPER